MHNIRYTELAEDDLSDLFSIIYKDKPTDALEYIDKLENFIGLLEDNPFMGIECIKKHINRDCRVLIYENYLIFYTVGIDEILIIRVLNVHTEYALLLDLKD